MPEGTPQSRHAADVIFMLVRAQHPPRRGVTQRFYEGRSHTRACGVNQRVTDAVHGLRRGDVKIGGR